MTKSSQGHSKDNVLPITQGLSSWKWWTVFAVDTFLLSQFFHWFKAFTLTPEWPNGLMLLLVISLLLLFFVALVYDSYVKERAKGTLQRRFQWFENIYQWQSRSERNSVGHTSEEVTRALHS